MNAHKAHLEVGAGHNIGGRDEYQDRMSGARVPLGQLYIVADGMGGHKGGALAAELTVQGLQQHLSETPLNAAVESALLTAFTKTNEYVYQRAHSGDSATDGMGSTAVLVLISGRVARVAHVGDSRAYFYRKGQLKQLTTDHTMVQKMVQAGMLKAEEAINHPNANVLERAIGSKPNVEVDISKPLRLHDGDAILLCSDGLSGYVTDPEIAAVLRSQAAVQDIPERLVNLALQKGGDDNVTVQFIQYGTRKEGQSRTTATMRVLKPPFRLWHIVVALVLGAAISAASFYGHWRLQGRPQLEAAAMATQHAENALNTLQAQLATTEQSATTKASKLQEELETTKTARKEAENEVKKLKGQLTTTEQSTNTQVANVQKQLAEARSKAEDFQKRLGNANARISELEKSLAEAIAQRSKLEEKLQALTAPPAPAADIQNTDSTRDRTDSGTPPRMPQ